MLMISTYCQSFSRHSGNNIHTERSLQFTAHSTEHLALRYLCREKLTFTEKSVKYVRPGESFVLGRTAVTVEERWSDTFS